MSKDEKTKGGSRIIRHKLPKKTDKFALGDSKLIESIEKHIKTHIGESETVLHEVVSAGIHLDIHVVLPSKKRKFCTLVTSGMSERPMNVPKDIEDREKWQYCELVTCLPAYWNMSKEDFEKEENYWPIRLLKTIARIPSEFDSWISFGHTIPNEEPFAPSTDMMCGYVTFPYLFEPEFFTLKYKEREVHFFYMFPLYKEEMDLKLEKGVDALEELFGENDVSFVVDPKRENVAR